jgi:hypothetical protein
MFSPSRPVVVNLFGLVTLELANKAVITTFVNYRYEKENRERITKSYFIIIICISIQRCLLHHGNSGASSLPPEIGRNAPRG